MTISKGSCVPETLVRLLVAVALLQVAWSSSLSAVDQSLSFLSELTESRIIGGTVAVQKAGKVVYSKGFGYADEVSTVKSLCLKYLHNACSLLHILSCITKESEQGFRKWSDGRLATLPALR